MYNKWKLPIRHIQEYLDRQADPDTLLPVQYNDLMRRRSALEGEHKLMFAVLEDAVESYLKHMNAKSRQRRLLFCEVQNWMNAKGRFGPSYCRVPDYL